MSPVLGRISPRTASTDRMTEPIPEISSAEQSEEEDEQTDFTTRDDDSTFFTQGVTITSSTRPLAPLSTTSLSSANSPPGAGDDGEFDEDAFGSGRLDERDDEDEYDDEDDETY